jgi:hypothetical protein
MATYTELYALTGDQDALLHKVIVAIIVKANALSELPSPTLAQKDFARLAYTSPHTVGREVLYAVLAKNRAATVAQILAATDLAIQTNVDAVIDSIFAV